MGTLFLARLRLRSTVMKRAFDSDIPVETRISSAVDLAHTALTERFEDLVMTEGFSDHGEASSPPEDSVRVVRSSAGDQQIRNRDSRLPE